MSFWPLATNLVEELRRASDRGRAVELGAGSGDFNARLQTIGISAMGLDVRRPADVVADARALPFRAGSIGLFVAANLLRHFDGAARRRVLLESASALCAGGRLCVIEDDADDDRPPSRNYRDALSLLTRFDPARGAARSPERGPNPVFGEPSAEGVEDNAIEVIDPRVPLEWMRARCDENDPRRAAIDALGERVEREGMRYGRYWYRVFRKDSA